MRPRRVPRYTSNLASTAGKGRWLPVSCRLRPAARCARGRGNCAQAGDRRSQSSRRIACRRPHAAHRRTGPRCAGPRARGPPGRRLPHGRSASRGTTRPSRRRRPAEVVGGLQDPGRFQQDRESQPDGLVLEQAPRCLRLARVVADQVADQDVGVDRLQRSPRRAAKRRATAASISSRLTGGPACRNRPNTWSWLLRAKGLRGRSVTPSAVTSTMSSKPACQPQASRTALGSTTCPLEESFVVDMGAR